MNKTIPKSVMIILKINRQTNRHIKEAKTILHFFLYHSALTRFNQVVMISNDFLMNSVQKTKQTKPRTDLEVYVPLTFKQTKTMWHGQ